MSQTNITTSISNQYATDAHLAIYFLALAIPVLGLIFILLYKECACLVWLRLKLFNKCGIGEKDEIIEDAESVQMIFDK